MLPRTPLPVRDAQKDDIVCIFSAACGFPWRTLIGDADYLWLRLDLDPCWAGWARERPPPRGVAPKKKGPKLLAGIGPCLGRLCVSPRIRFLAAPQLTSAIYPMRAESEPRPGIPWRACPVAAGSNNGNPTGTAQKPDSRGQGNPSVMARECSWPSLETCLRETDHTPDPQIDRSQLAPQRHRPCDIRRHHQNRET